MRARTAHTIRSKQNTSHYSNKVTSPVSGTSTPLIHITEQPITEPFEAQLEEVLVENYEDAMTPGPGAYNVEYRATGFRKTTKDEKY